MSIIGNTPSYGMLTVKSDYPYAMKSEGSLKLHPISELGGPILLDPHVFVLWEIERGETFGLLSKESVDKINAHGYCGTIFSSETAEKMAQDIFDKVTIPDIKELLYLVKNAKKCVYKRKPFLRKLDGLLYEKYNPRGINDETLRVMRLCDKQKPFKRHTLEMLTEDIRNKMINYKVKTGKHTQFNEVIGYLSSRFD